MAEGRCLMRKIICSLAVWLACVMRCGALFSLEPSSAQPSIHARPVSERKSLESKKGEAIPPPSREGDPRELFARANRLYEAGNYEGALGAYRALVRQGFRGGNLYYNLGNTYFKLDDKGHAILFYKKARKLKPRDQDIASNLEYALSLIEDKIEPRPRSWVAEKWSMIVGCFTLGEVIVSAATTYWLLCAVLIIFIYVRPWRAIVLRIAGVLLLVIVVMMGGAISRAWLEGQEEAVVISKEAKVRYGPSDKDVAAFVLHEGAVVEIENRKGEWYQVSLPDGKAGWLEKGSCGTI